MRQALTRRRSDRNSPDAIGTVEGRDLTTGNRLRVGLAKGRIASVEDLGQAESGPWIGPGLVDLQMNGCAGFDFNADLLEPYVVSRVSGHLAARGITSYLPTLITGSEERITRSLGVIARAADSPEGARVAGIHLEGPFISPEEGPRGAHPACFVRAPDWDLFQRWQEAAMGRIRLLTLSPEWPRAYAFIERCVAAGVVVAIGHTAATEQQIRDAVAAGARLSTHLGNGSHPSIPRHTGYFWEQLGCDDLHASVIADGAHLPVPVLRTILRAKGRRALVVSDAVSFTSLEPGEYEASVGGRVVLTEDGRLLLAGDPRLLAGSVRLLDESVAHLVRSGLSSLAVAWEMCSTRPARLAGVAGGTLEPGQPADLVQFAWDGEKVTPCAVYREGRLIAGASEQHR